MDPDPWSRKSFRGPGPRSVLNDPVPLKNKVNVLDNTAGDGRVHPRAVDAGQGGVPEHLVLARSCCSFIPKQEFLSFLIRNLLTGLYINSRKKGWKGETALISKGNWYFFKFPFFPRYILPNSLYIDIIFPSQNLDILPPQSWYNILYSLYNIHYTSLKTLITRLRADIDNSSLFSRRGL